MIWSTTQCDLSIAGRKPRWELLYAPLLRKPKLLLSLPSGIPNRIFRTAGGLGRLSSSLACSLNGRIRRAFRRVGCPLPALFRFCRCEWRRGRLPRARGDLAKSACYATDGVAEAAAEGTDLDARSMLLAAF